MLNPGAIDLKRYLERTKQSASSFAAAHKLARVHLHKVLSGEAGTRVTVDFAFTIQRATGGKIPMDRWVSPDVREARRSVAAA